MVQFSRPTPLHVSTTHFSKKPASKKREREKVQDLSKHHLNAPKRHSSSSARSVFERNQVVRLTCNIDQDEFVDILDGIEIKPAVVKELPPKKTPKPKHLGSIAAIRRIHGLALLLDNKPLTLHPMFKPRKAWARHLLEKQPIEELGYADGRLSLKISKLELVLLAQSILSTSHLRSNSKVCTKPSPKVQWWTLYNISPVCQIRLKKIGEQYYKFEIALSEKVKNHLGDTLLSQEPLARRLTLVKFFKEVISYMEPKSPVLQKDIHSQHVLSQAVDSAVKTTSVY